MTQSGALIFKAEQMLFNASVDYSSALEPISKEESALRVSPGQGAIDERMRALQKLMPPEAYKELADSAEASIEALELEALKGAKALPGVEAALDAAKSSRWSVVVASDLGEKPVSEWLKLRSLSDKVDLVSARTRLDERNTLEQSLSLAKEKLKGLDTPVYFCNSSRDTKEAKSLGIKCFVLPSKSEPFSALFMAKPDGLLMNLEELPQMLSLPSMHISEPKAEPEPAVDEGADAPVSAP